MFAAALWLTVATKYGLPVSTTHSIVGGILGIGIYVAPDNVDWEVVTKIVMSWVASPLLGGILAYTTFVIVKKVIMDAENPIELLKNNGANSGFAYFLCSRLSPSIQGNERND